LEIGLFFYCVVASTNPIEWFVAISFALMLPFNWAILWRDYRHDIALNIQPCDGADREPPYYPAFHDLDPSIRCPARHSLPAAVGSRQLSLFSLGL
jgi:hypothetical protein